MKKTIDLGKPIDITDLDAICDDIDEISTVINMELSNITGMLGMYSKKEKADELRALNALFRRIIKLVDAVPGTDEYHLCRNFVKKSCPFCFRQGARSRE